jgi:hypothetical protein
VDPIELTVGISLAVLLVVVAVSFAFKQRQTLARLRHDTGLSLDDRRYLYRQVVRRLLSCLLLLALAAFLVGWFFLESGFEGMEPIEPGAAVTDSAKDSLWLRAYYVIGGLLLLMAVMALAVVDLLATARFGARHRRLLEEDRRAVLQAEVERLRRERHGLNGGL